MITLELPLPAKIKMVSGVERSNVLTFNGTSALPLRVCKGAAKRPTRSH
jgi:hypothetical protein